MSKERWTGSHSYLALLAALATAFTVFVISHAYSPDYRTLPARWRR